MQPLFLPHLEAYRSEEHTSELQSPCNLVCRLLLEKRIVMRRESHGNAAWLSWRRRRRTCRQPQTASSPPTRAIWRPSRRGKDDRVIFFFFNDTGPPEISPLPLRAPLPF